MIYQRYLKFHDDKISWCILFVSDLQRRFHVLEMLETLEVHQLPSNCLAERGGGDFKVNSRGHIHQADKGALKKVQVWKEVSIQKIARNL